MPKISVIVPTFKTAKYLPKCLDSILNQTFQDFEIIIVSDGPNEDHKIADEYAAKDNRITVIKDVNKGLGGARNAAMEIAQGSYIAFVDSDDWVALDAYEKALACFSDEVDVVVFGSKCIYENEAVPYREGLQEYLKLKYDKLVKVDNDVIFSTNVHAWNKIYKKSIIDEFKITFPKKMQYEDFPFFFQYFMHSKQAYYLNEDFYYYFQRESSEMAKSYLHKYELAIDHINGCEFLYNKLQETNCYKDNSFLFCDIYSRWIDTGLRYCRRKDKKRFCQYAYDAYKRMNFDNNKIKRLVLLNKKRFGEIINYAYKETMFYIFGLIPFIKIKRYPNRKAKFYLFGILIFKSKTI